MRTGINARTGYLVLLFTLMLGGYSWYALEYADSRQTREETDEPEAIAVVSFTVEGLDISTTERAEPRQAVRVRRGTQEEDQSLNAEGIQVTFFEMEGSSFDVRANRGWFDQKTGDLILSGEVHAASTENDQTLREFYAEEARYKASTGTILARGTPGRPILYRTPNVEFLADTLQTDERFEKIQTTNTRFEAEIEHLLE